jgi:UDP-2,3-diacylglucosamine pyrophosphatase LpxH
VFKIVMSDLHIGAGRIPEGNLLEDFEQDDEMEALLADLAAESEAEGREAELILNGDIFEFWQVPALKNPDDYDPKARYPSRCYLATREQNSINRMILILRGHPVVFSALKSWLRAEAPRRSLTVIQGNHDIQIHWPGVQDTLRDALDAHGDREPLLRFEPLSVNRDGIFIEHGNQYADPLNRHPNMLSPFHTFDRRRIRMVPGGPISIRVVNRMERKHYWISSVKPLPSLFWFLWRFQPRAAIQLVLLMLPHLPRLLWLHRPLTKSSKQLAQEIREMEAEFEDNSGNGSTETVEEDLIGLPSFERVLTDEEIAEDPFLSHGLLEEHYLHARLHQVARRRVRDEGARVVVFGHTHTPSVERMRGGGVWINSGSWTWMLDMGAAPAQAWRRLIRHEDLHDVHYHLTYARIDYDEDGTPSARLLEHDAEGGANRRPLREALALEEA